MWADTRSPRCLTQMNSAAVQPMPSVAAPIAMQGKQAIAPDRAFLAQINTFRPTRLLATIAAIQTYAARLVNQGASTAASNAARIIAPQQRRRALSCPSITAIVWTCAVRSASTSGNDCASWTAIRPLPHRADREETWFYRTQGDPDPDRQEWQGDQVRNPRPNRSFEPEAVRDADSGSECANQEHRDVELQAEHHHRDQAGYHHDPGAAPGNETGRNRLVRLRDRIQIGIDKLIYRANRELPAEHRSEQPGHRPETRPATCRDEGKRSRRADHHDDRHSVRENEISANDLAPGGSIGKCHLRMVRHLSLQINGGFPLPGIDIRAGCRYGIALRLALGGVNGCREWLEATGGPHTAGSVGL